MPRTATTRSLLATLLLLPACGVFGLSDSEQRALAEYQNRAQHYWSGRSFNQALFQARKGLELDPDDYKLRWISASCYLFTSPNNPGNLDRAKELFEQVYDERAPEDHHPNFLLNYAQLYEQLGMRENRRAHKLETAAEQLGEDDLEADVKKAKGVEHRALARAHLERARRHLEMLLDRDEQVLNAHYQLMGVCRALGDHPAAFRHGALYLEEAKVEQGTIERQIEEATTPGLERTRYAALEDSRKRARTARTYLASLHYDQGNYEKTVALLDEVIESAPHEERHYHNRGQALLKLGRVEEARRDFQQFLIMTDLPEGNEMRVRARRVLDRRP